MKRLIERDLLCWKTSRHRKPLLVRGARQVGKTTSVTRFGRDHFESMAVVDLEKRRSLRALFDGDLDVARIVAQLEVALECPIRPGQTLLFFDEIQSCPRAIMALRYFHEDLPGLHVAAAGSLLEFATDIASFPVGRLEYLDMHPLTFAEFLRGCGKERAADLVLGRPEALSEPIHRMLLAELKNYFFVGGMPESVRVYRDEGSILASFEVLRHLTETYRDDFGKYAPRADPLCLDEVFAATARSVGLRIKYSRLSRNHTNPKVHRAFDLLCRAQVIRKVRSANPPRFPLGASASEKRFKALALDLGICHQICGVRPDTIGAETGLLSLCRGALAEQFVGQELVVSQSRVIHSGELYFWARDVRGSSAEVDFLASVNGRIHPVEVKSGAPGRLRSLHLLLDTHPDLGHGMVFSTGPYSRLPEQRIEFLPLYYAFSATRSDEVEPVGGQV